MDSRYGKFNSYGKEEIKAIINTSFDFLLSLVRSALSSSSRLLLSRLIKVNKQKSNQIL